MNTTAYADDGFLIQTWNPRTGWRQVVHHAKDGSLTTWVKARGGEWKRLPYRLPPVQPLGEAINYTPRPFGPVRHSCGINT